MRNRERRFKKRRAHHLKQMASQEQNYKEQDATLAAKEKASKTELKIRQEEAVKAKKKGNLKLAKERATKASALQKKPLERSHKRKQRLTQYKHLEEMKKQAEHKRKKAYKKQLSQDQARVKKRLERKTKAYKAGQAQESSYKKQLTSGAQEKKEKARYAYRLSWRKKREHARKAGFRKKEAAFKAQVGHESGDFKSKEKISKKALESSYKTKA